MIDVLYYAEVEFTQKDDINLKVLEELEDRIFEGIEILRDEYTLIDEETILIDEEEGGLILMTEEYDNLKELKEKTFAFLNQTVEKSKFNTNLYFYKTELIEEIKIQL